MPGGQVVRRRPLEPLFVGSNPTRAASNYEFVGVNSKLTYTSSFLF